jgi:superfamily II DNA or RNA helicase
LPFPAAAPRTRRTPRPYQLRGLGQLREKAEAGKRRLLCVAPTGAGKTTIAGEVIDKAKAKGLRSVFLAHRKELIDQCSKRLDDQGIEHGVIMANHPRWLPWLPVQVASVQTLSMRLDKIPPFDLYIIDEAHRSLARTYREIVAMNPKARLLGLTATPWRADGRGLGGELYEDLVVVATPAELRDLGYLVPVSGFAFDKPDLSKVKTTAGDYNENELGALMGQTQLVGNVVAQWKAHAAGLRTVVFAVHVEHSQSLARQFKEAGVRAEHLDGTTPKAERERILQGLAAGTIEVVCNVGVLTEGWDCPRVECGILARPTQSVGLYLQMVGRLLRPVCRGCGKDCDWRLPSCPACGSADLKRLARLHDHAGSVTAHGLPFDEREYSLEAAPKKKKKKKGEEEPETVRTCMARLADGGMCMALYNPAEHECCPVCGFCPEPRKIVEVEGRAVPLEELEKRAAAAKHDREKRYLEYVRLLGIAKSKGYKTGWASNAYKAQFKCWPEWMWQRRLGVA